MCVSESMCIRLGGCAGCVSVCLHRCVRLCVYVNLLQCMFVCMFVCMCTGVFVCTGVCKLVCLCISMSGCIASHTIFLIRIHLYSLSFLSPSILFLPHFKSLLRPHPNPSYSSFLKSHFPIGCYSMQLKKPKLTVP